MDIEGSHHGFWRPSFDEVKESGFLCFRAPGKPVQPLRQQFCHELKRLFTHPCEFTRGSETWREIFAVSSVRCIPATALFVLRLLCAAAQSTAVVFSLRRGPKILHFFCTWTTLLVAIHYVALSLCSAAALLVKPRRLTQRLSGQNVNCKDPADNESLPTLLKLVESVSSAVVGASFVTCIVFWTVMRPAGDSGWIAYFEHVCFIPVFILAIISRIPYRLQHMWTLVLFALAYGVLCAIVAFVPISTGHGRVGYIYSVMQYQTEPIKAWVITGVFTLVLPPISYVLFWFALRFNNPHP